MATESLQRMRNSLSSTRPLRKHCSAETVSARRLGEHTEFDVHALPAADHLIIPSKSFSTCSQTAACHVLELLGYDQRIFLRYRNFQFADADFNSMSTDYQVLGSWAASKLFEPLTNFVLQQGRLIDWDSDPEALRCCEKYCVGEKAPSGHSRMSVAFRLSSHSAYVCHVSRRLADWPSLDKSTLPQLVGALYLMSVQLETSWQQLANFEPDVVSLTAREIEALNWCKFGKTYADVGAILGISSKTVDFHMTNVMRKLSVNDKTSAILAAASRGIISL